METIVNEVNVVNNVNKLNILDFNCKNVLTCGPLFKEIENYVDICLLQEHWLFDCQCHLLNEINDRFYGVGKAVDSTDPIPPIQMPRGMVVLPSYGKKKSIHSLHRCQLVRTEYRVLE